MHYAPDFISAVLVLALALGYWWRRRRTQDLEPLGADERAVLMARIPQLPRLPPPLRERHAHKVAQFLADKRFYGCDGLSVSRGMALLVAGMACLLDLRSPRRPFPALRSVLIYPGAFRVRDTEPDELGLVHDDAVELAGESWDAQRVILSWEDVLAALDGDAMNVVAHEFAHQLDDEYADAPGAPPMADFSRWSAVMGAHWRELQEHGSPVLDDYGSESPTEFFAVAVEAWLQSGAALRTHHPQLHALLSEYFGFDPAATAN